MPAFCESYENCWIVVGGGGWWEECLTPRSTIVKDWPIVNLSHKVSRRWHTHPVINITRSRIFKSYSVSHSVDFIQEALIQVEFWLSCKISVDFFPHIHESILSTSQSPGNELESTESWEGNVWDIGELQEGKEFFGLNGLEVFGCAQPSFSWNLDPSSLRQYISAEFFQTEMVREVQFWGSSSWRLQMVVHGLFEHLWAIWYQLEPQSLQWVDQLSPDGFFDWTDSFSQEKSWSFQCVPALHCPQSNSEVSEAKNTQKNIIKIYTKKYK